MSKQPSRRNPPDADKRLPSRKRAGKDNERRLRQAARHARTLRLLELIQGRGRWDAPEIARELECSERTVYRDLAVLELAGVPWFFDEAAKCYRVRSGFRFPQLNLTDDELLGQTVASIIAATPGLGPSDAGQALLRKVSDLSDDDRTALIEDAQQVIEVLGMNLADHSRHHEIIHTAQLALLRHRQVSGQYESPYGAKPIRLTLHPYRLCLVKQAWYLIGRPSDSNLPKTYRIARFKTLRMIDSVADLPADFDLKSYFGNAWGVFRGDQTFDVEVEFTKEAAPLVTESEWHSTQKVRRHKDGSATLSFRVDGLNEIIWWVLGWTGRAKVIQPPELREMVVANLRRSLKDYED
jgi:predicted DNA-binding transcriptional regulator YafY